MYRVDSWLVRKKMDRKLRHGTAQHGTEPDSIAMPGRARHDTAPHDAALGG